MGVWLLLWALGCGDGDGSDGGDASDEGASGGAERGADAGSSVAGNGSTPGSNTPGRAGTDTPTDVTGDAPGDTPGDTPAGAGPRDAGVVDATPATVPNPSAGASGVCTACDGACMEELSVGEALHVDGAIDYPDTPPAGGMHGSCWATYGSYTQTPLRPEVWVHNLEHGAVVFLYNCPDGCADDVDTLEELVGDMPRTLVTAYDAMPEGFAAVAWGRRLVSSCLDVDAMYAFYEEAFDRAPESVPSGAPDGCP